MKNLYLKVENFGTTVMEALTKKKDRLHDLLKDTKALNELQEISSEHSSIVLVGHSSDQYFASGKTVSFMSAKDLAKSISNKYRGDKTLLTDFFLVSCEAGMRINEQPSYAEIFSSEMQKLGFTNLRVHAMTPPPDMEVSGMIVQTHGTVNDGLHISAWAYKNKEDEAQDKELCEELALKDKDLEQKQIEYQQNIGKQPGSITQNKAYLAWQQSQTALYLEIQSLKQRIKEIQEKQNQLRLYTCKDKPYQEAFSEPSNTIYPQTAQSSELTSSTEETISNQFNDESQNLLLLTAKDGIFAKIVRYFQGTDEFTLQLARNLKVILHEESILENEKIGITKKIQDRFENQSIFKTVQKTAKNIFANSITDDFLFKLLNYLKENPEQSTIKTIDSELNEFIKQKGADRDACFRESSKQKEQEKIDFGSALSEEVKAYTQKRIELNNLKQEIKTKMTEFIDNYITQFASFSTLEKSSSSKIEKVNFADDTSELHKHKVNVMVAIRNYLQSPTPANWEEIKKAKNEFPQWNKGFFSKVGYVADKLEAFHEEITPSSSPKTR